MRGACLLALFAAGMSSATGWDPYQELRQVSGEPRFLRIEILDFGPILPLTDVRAGRITYVWNRWRAGITGVNLQTWGVSQDWVYQPALLVAPVHFGYTLVQLPRPFGPVYGTLSDVFVEATAGWFQWPSAKLSLVWQADLVGIGLGAEIGGITVEMVEPSPGSRLVVPYAVLRLRLGTFAVNLNRD